MVYYRERMLFKTIKGKRPTGEVRENQALASRGALHVEGYGEQLSPPSNDV